MFIYQNKLYNIFHGLPGFSDFPSDTEFDLDYLSPEAHLRGVYADVRRQFPRHALVAVGWSARPTTFTLAPGHSEPYSGACAWSRRRDASA